MKYAYEGADKEEIISSYKIVGENIIVNFLDGSSIKIPLTLMGEQEVQNEMLKQAKDRNDSDTYKRVINGGKAQLLAILLNCLTILLNTTSDNTPTLKLLLTCASACCIALCGKNYLDSEKESKDIEKYDIYLKIKPRLDRLNNSNLFNGGKELNINTLDNFSLEDIKQIKENLKRVEYFSRYRNSDFVKKR